METVFLIGLFDEYTPDRTKLSHWGGDMEFWLQEGTKLVFCPFPCMHQKQVHLKCHGCPIPSDISNTTLIFMHELPALEN